MLALPSGPTRRASLACALTLAVAACQAKSSDDDSANGGSAGATSATGGAGVGASGGASATGGTPATGGASATGGGGGTTGGTTGGSAGTTSGSAGLPATGGTPATGGAGASGGVSAAGGASASGGASATGGTAGDATGTAGNSPGGASGSAGSASGGSAGQADPCATALYCDDFESYTTAPNGKWTVQANTGAVAIDSTQHVSGTKSVKFTTQSASYASAMMRLSGAAIFPVDPNVVYGRMMFRVESVPMASVHWTIIAGLGTVPGQTYHALYRYGGQHPITTGSTFVGSQMMANYDTPDWYSNKDTPGSDCWHHANERVIPAAKWTCIEWKFDGASNGMQLWLDDVPADDLTVTGHGDGCVNAAADFPWTAPTFASMDLGWESYQQDDARTAYIDDVVLSKTKIGCP